MMKIYFYAGYERQYEEGKQPEGAVEVVKVDAKAPAAKAKEAPANKSRKAKTK